MRVEGYISKKNVIRWLEAYEYMAAGDSTPVCDGSRIYSEYAAVLTNSGPKNYDGISGGQLNKIMLDQAISKLSPLKRSCIEAKYIEKLPLSVTLKALEISAPVYRDRVKQGIDDIYRFLNGKKADQVRIPGNHKLLMEKILENT